MDLDMYYPAEPPAPALLRSPTHSSSHSSSHSGSPLGVPGSHTVTVPNTRQKSCNACVAGKRGCDKKEPTCSRCAARKVPCVYRRRRAPSRGSDSDSDQASPTEASAVPVVAAAPAQPMFTQDIQVSKPYDAVGGSLESDDNSALALRLQHPFTNVNDPLFGSVMDMDLDHLHSISPQPTGFGPHELALLPSGNSPPSLLSAHSDSSLYNSSSSSSSASSSLSGSPPNPTLPFSSSELNFNDSVLDYSFLDSMPSFDSLPMESEAWLNQCTDFPELPALEMRQFAYSPDNCDLAIEQANKCNPNERPFFQPWELKDPRSKIGCMLSAVKALPSTFAQTRAAPFINPELYRTRQPRAITHAWTACTVYAARTPATDAWATRVVVEGAAAVLRSPPLPLHEDPSAYTASGKVDTHALLDRLAAVQALLLYQIIRSLDGDLMLSTHAERDNKVLQEWTIELAKIRNQLEDEGFGGVLAFTPSGQTIAREAPSTWENWVLLESVRRTVIKALCVIASFEALRGRPPPCCIFEDRNTFTMSRHLWTADSSANFYYAWRNKPQFFIAKMQFESQIKHVSPEDVCDFGLPFLKMKMGVDAAESFMLTVPPGMEIY